MARRRRRLVRTARQPGVPASADRRGQARPPPAGCARLARVRAEGRANYGRRGVSDVRLPKPSFPLATADGKCPYSSICVWKQITETAAAPPAPEPVEVATVPAPMRDDERGDWTRRLRQAEQRIETA